MAVDIGVITYNYPHLKTEQVVKALSKQDFHLTLFTLPFFPRTIRSCIFNHRPFQFNAISPHKLVRQVHASICECESDLDIYDGLDYYIITGAGILSQKCLKEKKIINCHPGLLPISRGLDAFKWSVYNRIPVGNTLHFIDKNIDEGQLIFRLPTAVYPDDTLETFAERHYQSEIQMLSDFMSYLNRSADSLDLSMFPREPAHRRMPKHIERKMLEQFPTYKKMYQCESWHKAEKSG